MHLRINLIYMRLFFNTIRSVLSFTLVFDSVFVRSVFQKWNKILKRYFLIDFIVFNYRDNCLKRLIGMLLDNFTIIAISNQNANTN